MSVRWIAGAVVGIGLLAGCGDDGRDASRQSQGSAVGRDVKSPASRSAELETWTRAGAQEGSSVHVTIDAPDTSSCTIIGIGKVRYAALWPSDAVREKDGVRLY